jgi:SAM-dependent methyltransferase
MLIVQCGSDDLREQTSSGDNLTRIANQAEDAGFFISSRKACRPRSICSILVRWGKGWGVPASYGKDLAYVHDAGHTDFARAAGPSLMTAIRKTGLPAGLVVDLGCGSGVWAQQLANAGYTVLGIDISPPMIALARSRVPEAEFRIESLLSTRIPRCVAVTALGECFSYMFDTSNSRDTLRHLFHRIYRALDPGGVLIFDVATPGRITGTGPQRGHSSSEDWAVFVESREDRRRRILVRRITTFRKVGNAYRRSEETHTLRLYTREQVERYLRCTGFQVRVLGGYGKLRFLPGLVGFLARK